MNRKIPKLECKLIVDKEYASSETANITVRLNNLTDESIKLLEWNTPLEGLFSNFLDIRFAKRNAKMLPYKGILTKRGKPQDDNYITIPPNGSREISINIFDGYLIPFVGKYRIRASFFVSYKQNNTEKLIQCKSDAHFVKFSHAKVKQTDDFETDFKNQKNELLKNEIDFKKGLKDVDDSELYDDSKKKMILDILDKALDCVKKALVHLNKLSTPEYLRWFGKFNQYRWHQIYFNCLDIYFFLTNFPVKVIEYGNDCLEGTKRARLAYVFLGETEIYVCESFWNLDDCGRDSKLGTILHELSHIAAGTDDHIYEEDNCLELAINYPTQAAENADNYEYFFEDICC